MTVETKLTCDKCHQEIDQAGPYYRVTYVHLLNEMQPGSPVERHFHENHAPGEAPPKPEPQPFPNPEQQP